MAFPRSGARTLDIPHHATTKDAKGGLGRQGRPCHDEASPSGMEFGLMGCRNSSTLVGLASAWDMASFVAGRLAVCRTAIQTIKTL